ncbi:hypothetical protein TNCV_3939221 [Trichonephila clavipes]|nr:hypothetical protein TNCV_3939221 [Trichonephila clavipes]
MKSRGKKEKKNRISSTLSAKWPGIESGHGSLHQNSVKRSSFRQQVCEVPERQRKKSVAMFRLIFSHDYFRKHFHRINVVSDFLCSLCSLRENMDLLHLLKCPALHRISIWE